MTFKMFWNTLVVFLIIFCNGCFCENAIRKRPAIKEDLTVLMEMDNDPKNIKRLTEVKESIRTSSSDIGTYDYASSKENCTDEDEGSNKPIRFAKPAKLNHDEYKNAFNHLQELHNPSETNDTKSSSPAENNDDVNQGSSTLGEFESVIDDSIVNERTGLSPNDDSKDCEKDHDHLADDDLTRPEVFNSVRNTQEERPVLFKKLKSGPANKYSKKVARKVITNEDISLDELTKKDEFDARFFSRALKPTKLSLINDLQELENTEQKLTELIGQTALAEELQPLLWKLKNFPPQCPYNVPSIKVKTKCYSIELIHLSFENAKKFCRARGGDLAMEPLTPEVWAKIIMGFPDFDSKELWIGATDHEIEGTFTFFNKKTITSIDSRWQNGSPSISTSNNCLALDCEQEIKFKDMDCHKKLHFLCQYPLTSLADHGKH